MIQKQDCAYWRAGECRACTDKCKYSSASDEPVTNVDELLKKYGYKTIPLLVEEFINRAPEFKGDLDLAALLGEAMADLESALRGYVQDKK